jgi:radical SAM protein with 4Fe4S-binding SPASM domain
MKRAKSVRKAKKTKMNKKAKAMEATYSNDSYASKHNAQKMAEMIEKWLGNPLSKRVMRFCTKRCDSCGRRIDVILRRYVGEDIPICLGCKTSEKLVRKILDAFIEKASVKKQDVLTNLRDPMWRKGLSSVLEGIGKYGPEKPFTSYAPFLIVWNISRLCNLRCLHCYENAHLAEPDELTTEQKLEAVDDMAEAGVAYLAISGGEPLMCKDFFSVAERIRENQMAFSIATNATLLTPEIAKKLKYLNCLFVQVSLDGATAKTHDSFRGRNVFKQTLKGIRNAVKAGLTVGIAMTVTKFNLKEVPKALDLAEKLGTDIFMHYNFIPTGRGKEIVKMDITPQEREDLLKYLASQIEKRKLSILSTAPQYARVCASLDCPTVSMTHFDTIGQKDRTGTTQFLAEFVGGCGTARLYCALEPNGTIEPCVFIPINCGNIKTDSLIDVWQDNDIMKKLRDREHFKGVCLNCTHRNICGGCRARAYGYYRDVQQSDPGCIFNLEEWNKIKGGR